MDDIVIGMGFAGTPVRGEKKDSGEYVLPKEVVEYHGIRHIRELESEAFYAMQEGEELPPLEDIEEDWDEDLPDLEEELDKPDDPDTLEVEKLSKSEQKNSFAIPKKAKTALIK